MGSSPGRVKPKTKKLIFVDIGTSNYRQDPSSGLSYPCIYSIVSITTGAAYWNVATFINVKFAMGKLK